MSFASSLSTTVLTWPMCVRRRVGFTLVSLALIAGCGHDEVFVPAPSVPPEQPDTLVYHPLEALPDHVEGLGLYLTVGDFETVTERVFAYEPGYPLWSNGSVKRRYVALPEGGVVSSPAGEPWEFPPGTLFFKSFFFRTTGSEQLYPVETRVIRRGHDGWDYASYAWDADGRSARRVGAAEQVSFPLLAADGEAFDHQVPTELECRACHESQVPAILGFSELQLAAAPLLEGSAESGLVRAAARGLLSELALPPEAVQHADAATREVLGYFEGNCVHCHNAGGGPSSAFDLGHQVALDRIIDQPTESSGSTSGIRVVPGAPEQSVLFEAVSGETDDPELKFMPPVGVQRRDAAMIESLRRWILALE